MGNQPKVHYPRKASWGVNVMCGTAASFTSEDPDKVTCKACIKFAQKLEAWRKK